jgi:outer membrane immunogenic protein
MMRHFATAVTATVIALTGLGAANAQAVGSWTGPYVGASVGSSFSATQGPSTSFLASGFLGWNVQAGRALVLGVEGDAGWIANSNWNWEASVRGRLGFLMKPATLLYATGGVAFAQVHPDSVALWSTKTGYAVGGGIETGALFSSVKARLEYRYTDLGTFNSCGTGTTTVATAAGCNTRASFQSVTVGLAIPLGAWAQPVRRVVK